MNREKTMSTTAIGDLMQKMRSPDMDFRYMALNDLLNDLQKSDAQLDDTSASKLIEAVLKTLEDKNGEVQNMGVKCLGPLVRRSKEAHVQAVVDRLCRTGSSVELKDLSSTALRTVILEVAPTGSIASSITKRLVPKLLAQLKDTAGSSDVLLDSIDVLIELLNRFGSAVSSLPSNDQNSLIKVLTDLLDNHRPAVRKRTVVALGSLSGHVPMEVFSSFMSTILQLLTATKSDEKLKTLISLMGQICRAESHQTNQRFSNYLQSLAPAVLESLQIDDDELRETALQSLESFVLQGGGQIGRYESAILGKALEFIKYDPNYSDDSNENDEDDDMEDVDNTESDLGSDFDDEGEYDDDDDISWKLRRCAAKLTAALISAQLSTLATISQPIVTALIARFNEREENVRVEVLQTFATLVNCSASLVSERSSLNRKRAREDENHMDTESATSANDTIKSFMPKITKGLLRQLGSKSVATKQAVFGILSELSKNRGLGIEQFVSQFIPLTEDTLASTQTSTNAVSTSNLRISALEFIESLLSSSSVADLESELRRMTPLVTNSLLSNNLNRISSVAVSASESLLNASAACNETQVYLSVCKALFKKLSAADLDQELRDRLIKIIGEAIHQAPGSLDTAVRSQACDLLAQKLKSESTRMIATIAIGHAASAPQQVSRTWCTAMIKEILPFTKNTNKVLRSTSVVSLSMLVRAAGPISSSTDIMEISSALKLLLQLSDPQIISASIQWLNSTIHSVDPSHKQVVREQTLPALAALIRSSTSLLGGQSMRDISQYIHAIAADGNSASVINALTTGESIASNVTILAQCIAIAIVADQDSNQLDYYIKAVQGPKTEEDQRALALYVVGECGRSQVMPQNLHSLILAQLNSPSETVKSAAAFALGNIAARDLDTYLPVLIAQLGENQDDHYFLAVAMKEVISHNTEGTNAQDLAAKSDEMWASLFKLASEERAKNVVAECVGRLTLIRPLQFLPELQREIQSKSSASRSVVIRAIRYTFTAASTSFDDQLRPFVVDFLSLMEDEDLEIRRLALSTLYSAAHNKPGLIQDHLARIMPLLYEETTVRPGLMHSVQMGPFKHIVDDGLDLRKSAFETLHTILDSFFAGIDTDIVLDIILRGLEDVHEIKTLCFLMLSILAQKAPDQTSSKLDLLTEKLMKIMAAKLRDAAVKQDKEKDNEIKRATLRCMVSLIPLSSSEATPGFNTFLEDMKATRAQEVAALLP